MAYTTTNVNAPAADRAKLLELKCTQYIQAQHQCVCLAAMQHVVLWLGRERDCSPKLLKESYLEDREK